LEQDARKEEPLALQPCRRAGRFERLHVPGMPGHDIVVIGASAGGVELLLNLAPELPPNLPASIFVVVHTASEFLSPLPELLSARGPLPAVHPLHGDPIAPGRIYVAPADNHLQVRPGFVEVVRGPKENGHRPAVDALFRTASWSYGSRVVGLVLSGFQDCGTAGMMSVKARGGLVVVQDPATAAAPDMPANVLARMEVDHVFQPLELPGLLPRLVGQPAEDREREPPRELETLEGAKRGAPVELVCPLCHGVLTATELGTFQHFRCHEGHAFSLASLAREQGEEMERALWAAARVLDESAALAHRLSLSSIRDLRPRFADRERTLKRQAEVIRKLLLEGNASSMPAGGGEADAGRS
jgi:two-component system chemotaxis response regulator CheB